MMPRPELIERRDALLNILETVEDDRTWQLTFNAYLTVCEVLEKSTENNFRSVLAASDA